MITEYGYGNPLTLTTWSEEVVHWQHALRIDGDWTHGIATVDFRLDFAEEVFKRGTPHFI
jgi:hypothetical protein